LASSTASGRGAECTSTLDPSPERFTHVSDVAGAAAWGSPAIARSGNDDDDDDDDDDDVGSLAMATGGTFAGGRGADDGWAACAATAER
jgi:hypothetical protein